ncbi:MAG: hypothetical protein L3J43_04985 [Sulfurovum sp.]|nr:hypothetical protein [Sulfurovum sp.]
MAKGEKKIKSMVSKAKEIASSQKKENELKTEMPVMKNSPYQKSEIIRIPYKKERILEQGELPVVEKKYVRLDKRKNIQNTTKITKNKISKFDSQKYLNILF